MRNVALCCFHLARDYFGSSPRSMLESARAAGFLFVLFLCMILMQCPTPRRQLCELLLQEMKHDNPTLNIRRREKEDGGRVCRGIWQEDGVGIRLGDIGFEQQQQPDHHQR